MSVTHADVRGPPRIQVMTMWFSDVVIFCEQAAPAGACGGTYTKEPSEA
ncbi:MAG TPA: hypothetical protein ACQGQH_02520 [Xylella sp.]